MPEAPAAAVGLIAGRGVLPVLAARALRARGHRVVAVGFDEETRAAVAPAADVYHALALGQAGGSCAPSATPGWLRAPPRQGAQGRGAHRAFWSQEE